MEYLSQFLHDLTKSGIYYAEVIDNVAEIFIAGDPVPAILLEVKDNVYHVNIRCDIPPRMAGQLIYDMTIIDEDIVINKDFFISQDSGILYGEDATALFLSTVYKTMESIQLRNEAELDDVTFVVEQPIYAYGNKYDNKNKMQRLWGDDLE